MNKDTLLQYFDQHHIPRRDVLPRIPLGMNPDDFWQEIQNRRRAKSTTLPIHGPKGVPYWYVTTDKMVNASMTLVEELMANDDAVFHGLPVLAPLEEVFYTSYVEGSPMTMKDAMEFLQDGGEPRDVEEQMIVNNRSALGFAASNLYHPVDEEYIQMLTFILTQNMEGGGREYRTTDWVEIPSMMGEPYELPAASSVADRVKELTAYLADPIIHPLLKAAVAQAWVLAARPFPEGNERLARLLSNVILIRAGYTFLAEVSLSALIARNGYPYYNAVANILRAENGSDLTYFLEYYLLLLAQAVEERKRRKQEKNEENQAAEIALARTALTAPVMTSETGTAAQLAEESADQHSPPKRTRQRVKADRDAVSESLAAEGFVSLLDETQNVGEAQPLRGGDFCWSGEGKVRAELATLVDSHGSQKSEIGQILLDYLDAGQYVFSVAEISEAMNLTNKQAHNLVYALRDKGIVESIGQLENGAAYRFSCGELSDADYTPEMIRNLNDLMSGTQSVKDKRIGNMLMQRLAQGFISLSEYEKAGEDSKWAEDMKLAEQMGFVRRITKELCFLLRDAKPCFEMLDTSQKKRARLMYDTFGEDTFSLDMVVATLDYSSSTASAYLHQFTLLRILDCRKEDVNLYQFLVNPKEHPEVFEPVA